jgi:hypothetical protein
MQRLQTGNKNHNARQEPSQTRNVSTESSPQTLSRVRMSANQHHWNPPSPEIEAWGRFLVEILLYLVLISAIIVLVIAAKQNMLAGPAIGAPAAGILALLRHRWRAESEPIEPLVEDRPAGPGIARRIVIEHPPPPGHREAVAEAFARAGLEVEVISQYMSGISHSPWRVRIEIEGTIEDFFQNLDSTGLATFDALIRDIWRARDGAGAGSGHVELVDREAKHVILGPPLPRIARTGWLVWDKDRSEWTNRAWHD